MSTFVSAREPSPPTVSIGMPVYNSASWIEPSIDSILRQSHRDLELIICDNASTDSTFAICERYARQDPRVRVYRNPQNIGANRNYLAVLKLARGPYFKWASSNDICAPTFIEKCVSALDADRSAVVAFSQTALFESEPSDARPYDHDVVLTSDVEHERFIALFKTMGLNNAFNGLMRREALLRAAALGNFQRADIALMAELALLGKFLLIEERLFFRRMSLESATKLQGAKEVDQHLEPQSRRPLRWQNWLFYFALLRATLRRGLSGGGSSRSVSYVIKQICWARRDLASDVKKALTQTSW